jgi:Rieske 2Fe-2S family protein
MTPVARESLAPALAPFGKSSTLPSEAYTSESVFRWELDHFFDRTWVCVGRSEDLRSAGDQRAVAIGLESALLTRGEEGGLHAFYNVCRHRGHELLETGCGTNQKFIRCPYHAWAYGLDGALAGAPGFGKLAGFDRDGYSLVPLSIVEWHGWLFANASGDAPAFGEHIGNLGELIKNHGPEELVTTARHDYEVAANWKVITENYHECYHCSIIHPEFSRVSPPTSSLNLEPEGLRVGGPMDLAEGTQIVSLTGERHAPTLPHLAEGQERKVYYFGLFPNLLLSVHPDYIMTHRLRPLAPTGRSSSASGCSPARRSSLTASTPPMPATSGTSPTGRTGARAKASSGVSPRAVTVRGHSHPGRTPCTSSSPWSPEATSRAKQRLRLAEPEPGGDPPASLNV